MFKWSQKVVFRKAFWSRLCEFNLKCQKEQLPFLDMDRTEVFPLKIFFIIIITISNILRSHLQGNHQIKKSGQIKYMISLL